jgi:adenosylhomocysteine nucleosidase
MPVAAITGLAAEARLLHRIGIAAIATGGHRARIEAAAARLLAVDTDFLSFGIAGGLAPGLGPGTLLLPRRVRDEDGTIFLVDETWHARIRAALLAIGLTPVEADIVGAPRAVADAAAKAALHRQSGAVAVDLESAILAAAARRAGRPFLVLRAIADPAGQSLPPAAGIALAEEGHPDWGGVLMSVLREPGQIPALVRLAGTTRRALAALRSAREVLRPSQRD